MQFVGAPLGVQWLTKNVHLKEHLQIELSVFTSTPTLNGDRAYILCSICRRYIKPLAAHGVHVKTSALQLDSD